MRSYRRLLLASLAGVVCLAAAGLASLATEQQEVFPFYSWFLFALVPGGQTTYQVLIEKVNGVPLPVPRFYNQAPEVAGNAHSVVAFKVIQRLGKACRNADLAGIATQRAFLEANLPPGTGYEVVSFRSDPIAQWRTRRAPAMRPVATFESGVR